MLFYSYTKRFTMLSHLVLGIADGLAPIAAWIALRNNISLSVLLLGAAVAFWVGGFDLIYACQDIDFDRHIGIHSFPQRFGVAAALYGSIVCHLAMVALLVEVIRLENLGWFAIVGLALMAALLAYEHWIVTTLRFVPPQCGVLQREWLYQPAFLFHLGSRLESLTSDHRVIEEQSVVRDQLSVAGDTRRSKVLKPLTTQRTTDSLCLNGPMTDDPRFILYCGLAGQAFRGRRGFRKSPGRVCGR